jgi:hypothetical protein
MAFELIITVDYELPADGLGDVRQHMVSPTEALMATCEAYGAKLTIMLEIGELWAFEDPRNSAFSRSIGYDPVEEIREQLEDAVRRGHDVQLHLHPHWLSATWVERRWNLDYQKYFLTSLDDDEMLSVVKRGKSDLESILRPIDPHYECIGFRAGHWATAPSKRYLSMLKKAGLKSDTSVFKWGCNSPSYDYRQAFSNIEAWYTDEIDINSASEQGSILEVPIATELSGFLGMLTPKRLRLFRRLYLGEDRRIQRALNVAGFKCGSQGAARSTLVIHQLIRFFGKHPKKLDYCKLTSTEMLSMLKRFVSASQELNTSLPIPLVLIGHSKQGHSKDLRLFLEGLRRKIPEEIRFATYRTFVRRYETVVGCGGGKNH